MYRYLDLPRDPLPLPADDDVELQIKWLPILHTG
jgi:hypothetical protein